MIDISQDIHSLTTFKRNTSGLIKRMKKTHRPLVLTVNGRAEAVVLEPREYQKLANRLDTLEGLGRGLAEARRGIGRSVDEVFDAIEAESSSDEA